ncbi:hypothetical protein DET54_1252 [Paenibacillus pabuli]|uniref:Uncharacterized protein n=1 Tax=Paenibacillus pabuli TaxID=1472 RepID=A0ABX9BBF7_9BACL|nr:hypothetical protein [Paenibacillus pabuli]RAI84424.1 hypothetical protein DET54_1252 [Paenibacillus pabuli]
MNTYKGQFFKNRDFYDWGIDYEVLKLKEKFLEDINQMRFYRTNFFKNSTFGTINFNDLIPVQKEIIAILLNNASLEDLNFILSGNAEELINKYPWLMKIIALEKSLEDGNSFFVTVVANEFMKQLYIHNKMCFVNTYTILDEYLSELIKSLGMYLDDFLSEANIKVNYKKLLEFEDDTDLKEFFVDSAMLSDKNLSGVVNKAKYLLKYLNAASEFKWNTDIRIFNEERNCVIHNKGYLNGKAIKNIGEEFARDLNLSENMKVLINNNKVDSRIDLTENVIDFFSAKLMKTYSDYIEVDLDEVDDSG